jgi:hypothetical protein
MIVYNKRQFDLAGINSQFVFKATVYDRLQNILIVELPRKVNIHKILFWGLTEIRYRCFGDETMTN